MRNKSRIQTWLIFWQKRSANLKRFFATLFFGLTLSTSISLAQDVPEIDEAFKQRLKQAIESADEFVDKFDAEVWLKDMNYRLSQRARHIPQEERLSILSIAHKHARKNNISPQLVLAVMQIESNFDRFAISKVGAQGLMQIMPFWKEVIGHPNDNLFDPETNIKYGCAILKIYLDRENQEIRNALARYHGSYPKGYYAEKVVTAWQNNWLYR